MHDTPVTDDRAIDGAGPAGLHTCACGVPRQGARLVMQVRTGVSLRQCHECDLIFTEPAPYAVATECALYAIDDASHQDSRQLTEYQGYARQLLTRADEGADLRGLRLLDVGCGAGELLDVGRAMGARVTGVEVNPHHRRRLVAAGYEVHPALEELGPGLYDRIVLSHVLEHIPQPVEFLARLRRLLTGRGLLVVSLPNSDSFYARRLGRHWLGLQSDQHLWHFTPATLSALLGRAGLLTTKIGAYALGRGLGPNGETRYARAESLVDSLGSTPFKLAVGGLLALDVLFRGRVGRTLRQYGELHGGDNLWAAAIPLNSSSESSL
jgi:SAM-dependent methyltransferase